jgi:hypothetical protein
MHAAVRLFPDVAPVAGLLVVIDLVDAALRAAHPGLLAAEPPVEKAQRRALALLRTLHRLRRDAQRYVEHHADLVGPNLPSPDPRQLAMF